MWLKLGNDFLNLDHVVRVKFNKGWKNGQEELVAEVEGLVKGEVQVFTRYRGVEAEMMQAMLRGRMYGLESTPPLAAVHQPDNVSRSQSPTLHDVKIP